MSQRAGDLGSYILSGYSPAEAARLASEFDKKQREKLSSPPPQNKETMQGAPLPKEDPKNPVSEVEGLFGVRLTKKQKWAWVIGITLGIYGLAYYMNKKK